MRSDTHARFDEVFGPHIPVRQQLFDIQIHQMKFNFAERWRQNLRFVVVPDTREDQDDCDLDDDSLEYSSEESEASSQACLTGELKSIADRNQGELRLPPQPIFQPKATCYCRKKRRFPRLGLSELRITTKNPAELPGCNHYVAISYCWKGQTDAKPQYSVQTGYGLRRNLAPSEILSRAIAFAAYHGVRLIWIDQECIVQDDREDKEEGIQSMDLVYQQATHAVALLNARITSEAQRVAFVKAMTGQDFEPHEFKAAVEALEAIAADRWLTRAWCYQETAAAGESMRLLIPCEVEWPEDQSFMTVPGELEVTVEGLKYAAAWVASWADSISEENVQGNGASSRDLKGRAEEVFSYLMEICPTAYQAAPRNPHFRFGCNAAEALHLMRDKQNSRTGDRLAILANICNFPMRLNTDHLQRSEETLGREHSFSVCFAVLAILNGDMSLIVGSKKQREALDGLEESPDEAFRRLDIPTWIPAEHTRFQSLPYREEYHPEVFRLTKPVICSAGLALSGHLWRVDQKVIFNSVQQRFASKWQKRVTGATSVTEGMASDELIQDVVWCILRKLQAEGLIAVAESIWHCIRPPTASIPRVEGADIPQEICADNKQLPDSEDFEDATPGMADDFRLHLHQIIDFEDYPHPLCSPLQRASSGYAWISRRVIEDGFLWFGRKEQVRGPTKTTTAEPQLERYCVVDCEGPMVLLTPQNDLLEIQPRLGMAAEPICWIVRETGKFSEHGEIFHGLDLVRGVWKTNRDPPMRYVLE